MEGASRPALLRSLIVTSSGHGAWPADVIMAITLFPAGRLKAALSEMISAGRFFSACRSVKGKGTRTTAKRSKFAIGLFVFGRMPLAQRALDRLEVLHVKRFYPPHCDAPEGLQAVRI